MPAPVAFQVMVKPTGPICNLSCVYCFYLEKRALYPQETAWRMKDEVLEEFTRQYIEAQGVAEVQFAWQGGEPTLLGVDFFRRAVELQRRFADGKKVLNAFQTNGILLDEEWCAFLAENRFLVGLSIDGPPALNDRYRRDPAGRPTTERVLHSADLMNRHGVEYNILSVVHRQNADRPKEVYSFLKGIGTPFLQFIPLIERAARPGVPLDATPTGAVTPWSVTPRQYGAFLCAVFDEWVRADVGRVYVQLFDTALGKWAAEGAGLCVFAERCGAALALEHNGDLYSCDHYVYPSHRLGNIMKTPLADLVALPFQERFGADKWDALPAQCRACGYRFACNGECPKHRFHRTSDGEDGLNYLCAGYRAFFSHADPYLRIMRNLLESGRPPSLVMESVRAEDLRRRMATAGRNDPCPCGSGRKFKLCHGAG